MRKIRHSLATCLWHSVALGFVMRYKTDGQKYNVRLCRYSTTTKEPVDISAFFRMLLMLRCFLRAVYWKEEESQSASDF